ncbi:hypothetical protein NQ317_007480 [Molorchus minor]|uniref:Angiotensin-converting enzyme n=1 Tax=Molorchus minor TaxID=1323400 RepID=A0ABQ9K3T4_9CUCU|nr:hypothetical protein NQ317_007480 [Molorchus minor]
MDKGKKIAEDEKLSLKNCFDSNDILFNYQTDATNKQKKEAADRLNSTFTGEMALVYDFGKICPYKNPNCDLEKEGLSLKPEIENIMAKSRDYDELTYVWTAWRDATGAKMKKLYKALVDKSNENARASSIPCVLYYLVYYRAVIVQISSDTGEMWRAFYKDANFIENMENIWMQIKPLYTELYKYVGRKLKMFYRNRLDISDGLVPAQVFGSVWAQSWTNIADIVLPFPKASKMNIEAGLKERNFTTLDMFKIADEFYQSVGLLPMGNAYNESIGAVFNKPKDGRKVVCHPSTADYCNGTIKVKMCIQLNFEDLMSVFHELGHAQYGLQYLQTQPSSYRDSPTPGFHEAIGTTLALSFMSPTHLQRIGLLNNFLDSYEANINVLLYMALNKVAFLPFGLLVDKWRWDVFNGSVPENKWNSHYWQYKKIYQRLKPPVERSDETDLDPGDMYNIPVNIDFIMYYYAGILEFQIFKSMCIEADKYDPLTKKMPLHKCDFYNVAKAGGKLSKGMQLGSSKNWTEVLEIMTGYNTISVDPLLEYFEPLYRFLKEENKEFEEFIRELIEPRIKIPDISILLFTLDDSNE